MKSKNRQVRVCMQCMCESVKCNMVEKCEIEFTLRDKFEGLHFLFKIHSILHPKPIDVRLIFQCKFFISFLDSLHSVC